ncbi:hypothetical protein DFH11DRAFT_1742962 [Phellopilus nigrolimitatus]|nr:hypothetical protein DFH11DRAFT_1742962 [Phellopilus nigrolimitatus]
MTVRFKNEPVQNSTIKLGYANAKTYECEKEAEACPWPSCYRLYPPARRTARHASAPSADTACLTTVKIIKPQIIVLQNKFDLIKPCTYTGIIAEASSILPNSTQLKSNIDAANKYVVKRIPIPVREPRLNVICSFDVNTPGAEVDELKDCIAGARSSLILGTLVEIRPAIVTKGSNRYRPIFSHIFAVHDGLIGVGTIIDPTLCRADRLVGQVLDAMGKLPRIYTARNRSVPLLRLLGTRTEDKKTTKVTKPVKNELLNSIGSTSTVLSVKVDLEASARLYLCLDARLCARAA